MKSRPLLAQVLAVNLLLVAGTVLVATLALDAQFSSVDPRPRDLRAGPRRRRDAARQLAAAAPAVRAARPDDLGDGARSTSRRRHVDVAALRAATSPRSQRSTPPSTGWSRGSRPSAARPGRAAIRAQERERRRIAQDLHDEVNQALTAVSLRLQASIEQAPPELRRELTETKRLSSQAMEELLALARQLRPAVLDDHGLLARAPQPGPRLRRPDRDAHDVQLPRDGAAS